MPDSVVVFLFYVALIAWAARAEYRRAKERRMEKQLEEIEEAEPAVVEASPAGRKFERRFNEDGASWEALEEEHALRILACSFGNVPALLEAMQTGEPVRTPFAEYRLVP